MNLNPAIQNDEQKQAINDRDLYDVLGVCVSGVSLEDVIVQMRAWIRERRETRTIAVTGMHGVMEARHNPAFKSVLDAADAVVPDGMPLIWLGRRRGLGLQRRVYGPELMANFCEQTAAEGYRHYFYGGAPGVGERLANVLQTKVPGLKIAGTSSPPFRPLTTQEDALAVEAINAARPDVLWVGLGTPKQEIWMKEHRTQLNVPVIVTVGAAFVINAGLRVQAPIWMRENGFEWLFRLAQEPKRLWKRYLLYGPEFLLRLSIEMIRVKPDAAVQDLRTM
jgi:N-acetylglucosaminyldiphosphoundecaprenol N-acetyl-beta-D-mannosaminyltransferase